MTPAASKSDMLRRAIEARRADAATARARHAALIDQLASNPDDPVPLRELGELESRLARAAASVESLEVALEQAQAAEQAASIAAAREATAGLRAEVLKAAAARATLAEQIDAQAAALIDSVRQMREAGGPIADNAKTVIRARYGAASPAFLNEASQILPAAAAGSTDFKFALADVIKRLVSTMDSMTDHVVCNTYVETSGRTFAAAAAAAAQNLEARL